MAFAEDTSLIRQVERDVLDREHFRFPLFKLPEDLAITRLLKVSGDLTRDALVALWAGNGSDRRLSQFGHILLQSLSHTLRWVRACCDAGPAANSDGWREEDDQALELIQWGFEYSRLATDHVAWSNSLIIADVDNDSKTIRFHQPTEMDVPFFLRQAHADYDWLRECLVNQFPLDDFTEIYRDWQRYLVSDQFRGLFPNEHVRHHPRFSVILAWVAKRVFGELPDDCSLSLYSLGDLRLLYSVLFLTSEFMRNFEDGADRALGHDNSYGTHVFQLSRTTFVDGLAAATGIDKKIIHAIVRDMTLDPERFHCSLTSTPFVESRLGTLFLLPRLFAFLEPERTVATVLTTGSGRSAYDSISTRLERIHVTQIADALRSRGFRVTTTETVTTATGEKITPDFIISDGVSDQVIVADYKNALAATAVAAVTNRLKEYCKGVKQVSKYVAAFEKEPDLARFHQPWLPEHPRFSGFLVFRLPMPLPVPCGSGVAVDNWFSLSKRLDKLRRPAAVSDLLELDAVPSESLAWRHTSTEICVGDWTYQRSMLVGLPHAAT